MTDAAPTVSPHLLSQEEFDVLDLDSSSAFMRGAGLIVTEVTGTSVVGHIDLTREHHTPWGIVHGGVYATAIESAASIGATAAGWSLPRISTCTAVPSAAWAAST